MSQLPTHIVLVVAAGSALASCLAGLRQVCRRQGVGWQVATCHFRHLVGMPYNSSRAGHSQGKVRPPYPQRVVCGQGCIEQREQPLTIFALVRLIFRALSSALISGSNYNAGVRCGRVAQGCK